MKIKSWLKYLIYSLSIISLLFLRTSNIFTFFNKQDLSINYCNMVISMILGVCIGLFLGLEHFINEIRKEGRWKVNLPKLILMGLPSLYFSLTHIFIYSGIKLLENVIVAQMLYLLRYFLVDYIILFQPIFGYIIITSVYKCNKKI